MSASFFRTILAMRAKSYSSFSSPAIVFSPHPDDETLGCGGLLRLKVQANSLPKVVIMTDGRHSHSNLISENKLAKIRATEAKHALQVLGLANNNISMLEYHDGRLLSHQDEVVTRIKEILNSCNCDEVYIPYRHESPLDHYATNIIVRKAMSAIDRNFEVYEYPIWFWANWPFVRSRAKGFRSFISLLVTTFRLLKDFNTIVKIDGVMENKGKALNCYQSQMDKMENKKEWDTLPEVFNGEWLRCFFVGWEIFYHYRSSQDRYR